MIDAMDYEISCNHKGPRSQIKHDHQKPPSDSVALATLFPVGCRSGHVLTGGGGARMGRGADGERRNGCGVSRRGGGGARGVPVPDGDWRLILVG